MSKPLWKQALVTVPQVDKAQWDNLGIVTRWLIASRFSVTLMTFTSAIIGILLAYSTGNIDITLSVLCTLGLVLAHASNNLINDYTDSIKGVDEGNYFRIKYGTHVLEGGLLSKSGLMKYIVLTSLAAILCGVYIVALRGEAALWLMLSGAFFVLFYTWPLKKLALGEISVLVVWGPLMVGGTYLVSSGEWSTPAALIGLLYALAPTSVIFGKHIDKLEMDKSKGIFSLPVILGTNKAKKLAQLLLISQYVLATYLFLQGYLGYGVLLLLLAIPTLLETLQVFSKSRPEEMPADFREEVWPLWFAPYAFAYTRKFSFFFLLMLITEIFI